MCKHLNTYTETKLQQSQPERPAQQIQTNKKREKWQQTHQTTSIRFVLFPFHQHWRQLREVISIIISIHSAECSLHSSLCFTVQRAPVLSLLLLGKSQTQTEEVPQSNHIDKSKKQTSSVADLLFARVPTNTKKKNDRKQIARDELAPIVTPNPRFDHRTDLRHAFTPTHSHTLLYAGVFICWCETDNAIYNIAKW